MTVAVPIMEQISIVSFNARGLRDRVKRRSVFRHLRINYPDNIVIMQETHSRNRDKSSWMSEWQGKIYFAHESESGQGGVAILFPPKYPHDISAIDIANCERIACVKIYSEESSQYILLIGVYGPAGDSQNDKCTFLDSIRDMLLCYARENVFVAGDFNIRLGKLDSSRDSFRASRASVKLQNILDEFSLLDSWRTQHPQSKSFTWRRLRPIQQSRIDYMFVSEHLMQNHVVRTSIDAGIMSDHSIITIDMQFSSAPRGPGLWMYNNTLLENESHVNEVKAEIKKAQSCLGIYQGNLDKGVKLEMLLSSIRVLAIRKGKQLAYERRREEQELYDKVNQLEAKIANEHTDDDVDEYENVKNRLDEFKEHMGNIAILRSHAIWMEDGEKSTKYFLRMARTRAAQSRISTIQSDNGVCIRGNKQILDECVKHFSAIYSMKCSPGRSFEKFTLDENAP